LEIEILKYYLITYKMKQTMNIIGAILILFYTTTNLSAQSNNSNYVPSCYDKYEKVFEVRGAKDVTDGIYDDVIISSRYRGNAECYLGKVRIKDGALDINSIKIKFEDGTYEDFKRTYKEANTNAVGIINGITRTMVTIEDELINILFINHIKEKKQAYKKAPEPKFDY